VGAVATWSSAAGKGAQKTSPKYFNDYKSEFDKICNKLLAMSGLFLPVKFCRSRDKLPVLDHF